MHRTFLVSAIFSLIYWEVRVWVSSWCHQRRGDFDYLWWRSFTGGRWEGKQSISEISSDQSQVSLSAPEKGHVCLSHAVISRSFYCLINDKSILPVPGTLVPSLFSEVQQISTAAPSISRTAINLLALFPSTYRYFHLLHQTLTLQFTVLKKNIHHWLQRAS